MTILLVDCDEQSNFYAATETGQLNFYQDQARNGTGIWAFGGQPQQIGQGWQDIRQLICGDGGVIYAIDAKGRLLYYKDLARNGTGIWAFGGVAQVLSDSGWNEYARVFSGGGGILYAIGTNGDLFYYRDEARDGTARWAFGGAPQKIGSGWNGFRDVAYGGDGIVYAVAEDGSLLWYRDLGRNGTFSWANGGKGRQIGQGWNIFSRVLSGQDGVLHGITPDGFMLFYREEARDGTGVWANGGQGQQIGQGWFVSSQRASVEGYAWPLSAAPGERVGFHVSARTPYTVTYLRLKAFAGMVGPPVASPFAGAAIQQSAPPEAWQDGCGWAETFALDVPPYWVSGLYSAQCVDTSGATSHIVFAVKPVAPRADFAVLANINTWNAYNDWGGMSKYYGNPFRHTIVFGCPSASNYLQRINRVTTY